MIQAFYEELSHSQGSGRWLPPDARPGNNNLPFNLRLRGKNDKLHEAKLCYMSTNLSWIFDTVSASILHLSNVSFVMVYSKSSIDGKLTAFALNTIKEHIKMHEKIYYPINKNKILKRNLSRLIGFKNSWQNK